jgi:probable F420-dependent oxidoreductase
VSGLSFGFVTSAEREEVAALEGLGVESLWVGGHVAAPNGAPEAMVKLAALAALTDRVRIGTSILLLPLYPPAIVAKQVADLDRFTGGRVTLGVGVGGEYEAEFRACGVPVKERGRRTDEAIGLIRRLWSAEEISHPGPFYPMQQVRIHPAPARPGGPPIIVAGRKDPAMARAARLGDGWMPYLYSPRAYAESVRRIRELADEDGRDLSGFEWMVFLFTNVGEDADAAREEVAGFLGGTYSQDFRQFVDRVAAAGTVEQVAARVQEYVDAGARHVIFAAGSRTDRRGVMERIMTKVAPRVRPPPAGPAPP